MTTEDWEAYAASVVKTFPKRGMRLAGMLNLSIQNQFDNDEMFFGETELTADMLHENKSDIWLVYDYNYHDVEQVIVATIDFHDIQHIPMLLFITEGDKYSVLDILKRTAAKMSGKTDLTAGVFGAFRTTIKEELSHFYSGRIIEKDIDVIVDALLLSEFRFNQDDVIYAFSSSTTLQLKKPISSRSADKIKYILTREVFWISDEADCPSIENTPDLEDTIDLGPISELLNEVGLVQIVKDSRFAIINK